MTEFIAWLCHSPRRLAVGGGTILVVLLVAGTAVFGNGSGAGASGPGAEAPGPGATASTTAQVPSAAPFVTAALGFVRRWSRLTPGESAEQWHAALVPLTTPELGRALQTTDPADLPGVAPAGEPVVRYVAQTSALVAIPLADSSSVLVSVVMTGPDALVSDVQPNVGDS